MFIHDLLMNRSIMQLSGFPAIVSMINSVTVVGVNAKDTKGNAIYLSRLCP